MRSKFMAVLLGLVACLALLLTIGGTAQAKVIETSGLNGSDATVKDRYGNVITDTTTMSKWSNYDIGYNWSIPDGVKIQAGDTAIVQLPEGGMKASDLTMPLVDSTGQTIGMFTIKAGDTTGTITFNDAFTHNTTNRKGTLNFYAKGSTTGDVHFNWTVNKVGWVAGRDENGIPTEVTWNVAFNPTGKDLGTVVVHDTLGPKQTFIPGSVVAHTGTYDQNGHFNATGTITPTVVQNGNELTFTFENVNTAVNMVYNAKLGNPADSGEVVNTATMNGSTVSGQVTWGGSGTGQGDPSGGSVKLTKTDATTLQALAGAVFKLVDSKGEVIKTDLTTDAKGHLALYKLAPGKYTFVETKAPDGYALNPEPIPFEIIEDSTAVANVELADKEVPHTGAVTLTKTDSASHQVLAGAVYELRGSDGDVLIPNLMTNAEGQLHLDNLAPGKYQLVEVKAPDGYELATEPVSFTIVSGATATVNVAATDTKTPTNPSEPENPENPENPEVPGQPGEPENPENPEEPEKPTEPENPSEPEKPGEPGTPTEPSTPGEPEKPGEPGTSTEPGKPSEPAQPTHPGTTGQSDQPVTPGQSGTTGQATTPAVTPSQANPGTTNATTAGSTTGTTSGIPVNGTTGHSTAATSSNATTGRLPQTDESGTHPIVALIGTILLVILSGLGRWAWRRQS